MKLSWTQPICDTDWIKQEGERPPIRLNGVVRERCSWCGETTTSGIYKRADPATVPYPAEDDDE